MNPLLDLEAASRSAGVSYATVRRWAKDGALTTYGRRPRMALIEDVQRVASDMRTRRLGNLARRRPNEQ